MSVVACPSCGASIEAGETACSYCGRRLPPEEGPGAGTAPPVTMGDTEAAPGLPARRRNAMRIMLVAVGVLLALSVLVAVLLAAHP